MTDGPVEPGPLGERVAQEALADVPVGQAYERHRMFLQTTAALIHHWERGGLWADNAASLVCHAADAYRRDVGRLALPPSRDDSGQYPGAPRGVSSRGLMDTPPAASRVICFHEPVFGGRGSSDRAPCRRRSRSRGDGVSFDR
jgi:hypothetical protein